MTHSLHREGETESLGRDYVVLTMGGDQRPIAMQKERLSRKSSRFYSVLKWMFFKFRIDRIFRFLGLSRQIEEFRWSEVLNSREELRDYLLKLKKADTGRSVVVSGLLDEISECLDQIGLSPHTIQFSLGYFGRTELLPEKEVLEITTMCGHHMVSPMLVESLVKEVSRGRKSREDAVETMGRLCLCEIFNKPRACELMEAMEE